MELSNLGKMCLYLSDGRTEKYLVKNRRETVIKFLNLVVRNRVSWYTYVLPVKL